MIRTSFWSNMIIKCYYLFFSSFITILCICLFFILWSGRLGRTIRMYCFSSSELSLCCRCRWILWDCLHLWNLNILWLWSIGCSVGKLIFNLGLRLIFLLLSLLVKLSFYRILVFYLLFYSFGYFERKLCHQ